MCLILCVSSKSIVLAIPCRKSVMEDKLVAYSSFIAELKPAPQIDC